MSQAEIQNTKISRRSALVVSAAAAISATVPALANATPDPTFGKIEAHKAAMDGFTAAVEESERLQALADEQFGRGISIPNLRDQTFIPHEGKQFTFREFVMVSALAQLGDLVPSHRFPADYDFWKKQLDEYCEQKRPLTEQADRVIDDAGDREREATEALVESVPDTQAGLFAMISHLGEVLSGDNHCLDDECLRVALINIAASLEGLQGRQCA